MLINTDQAFYRKRNYESPKIYGKNGKKIYGIFCKEFPVSVDLPLEVVGRTASQNLPVVEKGMRASLELGRGDLSHLRYSVKSDKHNFLKKASKKRYNTNSVKKFSEEKKV